MAWGKTGEKRNIGEVDAAEEDTPKRAAVKTVRANSFKKDVAIF